MEGCRVKKHDSVSASLVRGTFRKERKRVFFLSAESLAWRQMEEWWEADRKRGERRMLSDNQASTLRKGNKLADTLDSWESCGLSSACSGPFGVDGQLILLRGFHKVTKIAEERETCVLAFISVADKSNEKASLQSSLIPSTAPAESVQTGSGSV